jgi:hypothetical protein
MSVEVSSGVPVPWAMVLPILWLGSSDGGGVTAAVLAG